MLIYGPYIQLSAGQYRLAITGTSNAVNIWSAITLKLLHTNGTHQVEYKAREATMSDLLIEVEFYLPSAVANFEMQVTSNGRYFVEIADIAFHSDRRPH